MSIRITYISRLSKRARKLLFVVALLVLAPVLVIDTQAFGVDGSSFQSFHDGNTVFLAPRLKRIPPLVGVKLNILVVDNRVEAHSTHESDTTCHYDHDGVSAGVRQPSSLEGRLKLVRDELILGSHGGLWASSSRSLHGRAHDHWLESVHDEDDDLGLSKDKRYVGVRFGRS